MPTSGVRVYQIRFANFGDRPENNLPIGRFAWNNITDLKKAIESVREHTSTPYIDIWEVIDGVAEEYRSYAIIESEKTIYQPIPTTSYQITGWITATTPTEVVPGATMPSILCQKRLKARNNFKEWLESFNALSLVATCTDTTFEFCTSLLKLYRKCTVVTKSLDDYVTASEFPQMIYANRETIKANIGGLKAMELTDDSGDKWPTVYDDFKKMLSEVEATLKKATAIYMKMEAEVWLKTSPGAMLAVAELVSLCDNCLDACDCDNPSVVEKQRYAVGSETCR